MPLITRVLIAGFSFLVLLVIIHLVRQKKLDEKYAFLWVISGVILLVAPFAVKNIDRLSRAIGINYPPAFIFLVGFLVLFLIVLQYSVALSRLTKQNRKLAQRLAILEETLKQRGSPTS